ncbi:MAG: molybdopterin biosynthesis protein, partial [Candidatus Heimdallarchaeota archaeon]
RSITPYENIDPAGSDIMLGETILRKNDHLTPVRLGILAALGYDRVPVRTRLKVGILSSGDELRAPGESLPIGCLYDSNSTVLMGLVEDCGADPEFLGICPDNMNDFIETLIRNLRIQDIVLISGGTSAGEGDFSYRVITELGGRLLFHGISMKPGKPLAAGLVDGTLILTLPGFPASSIFSFNEVVAPLVCHWTKTSRPQGQTIQAKVGQRLRSTPGRTHFRLVHILKKGTDYHIFPVKGNSGSVSMLERGDGYIIIPAEVDYLSMGTTVPVSLLREELSIPDVVFIGSHDILIDLLFNDFRDTHPNYVTKLISTGSTGGLAALKQGASDIAGIHLLDASTNTYNIPYLETWELMENVTIIKAYNRVQGLYVPKGNPKGISRLEDLVSPDILFLNRNEGSGTRVLFDSLLKKTFDDQNISQQINGYSSVAYSHSATASSVKHGKVDVAMGIQYYAKYFGLDFIPIGEEEYDLIINNSSLEKPAVKALLAIFSSTRFRNQVETKIPNLKWTDRS